MRSPNFSYFTGILCGIRNNINAPTTLHRHKVFEEEEKDDQVEEDVVVLHTQRRP